MAHAIPWLGTLLETARFPALPITPMVLMETPEALPGAAFELRVGEALPLAHLAGALHTRIESGFLRLRFRALRERHLSAQRLVPRIYRSVSNPGAAAGA